jgi:hypothetical protein
MQDIGMADRRCARHAAHLDPVFMQSPQHRQKACRCQMGGSYAGEGGNDIVPDETGAEIPPGGKHDFMGQVSLYFSLQPFEQVEMPSQRYPFLDDAGIGLKVVDGN